MSSFPALLWGNISSLMETELEGQPNQGSFHRGRFLLGLFLGLVLGLAMASKLPPTEFQNRVVFHAFLLGGLGFGGWSLRWGRFPWMRALVTALAVALFVQWGYQLHPPSSRVESQKVRGSSSRIDAQKLRIGSLAPGLHEDEVKALRGEPRSSRDYLETKYGMTLSYQEYLYDNPVAKVTLLEGQVVRVEGQIMTLNNVALVKKEDSQQRIQGLLGIPSTYESRDGVDVYHLHKPIVFVRYANGKVADVGLTTMWSRETD